MRFASPWDRRLLAITAGSAVVLAVAVALVVSRLAGVGPGGLAVSAAVVALAAATVALSWALAPKGYSIDPRVLRIERPLSPIEIPLASIRAVGPAGPDAIRRSLRLGGSGGFFGYYGRFRNRRLGAFRLYATRTRDLVRIDTVADRFIVSPEPPDRFLELLLSRAPAAVGTAPDDVAPRPLPRRTVLTLVAAAAAVPLAVGAIVLALFAWSPRGASVVAGEIRVERELAPALVIPLADVLEVGPLAPARLRGTWRVAGTALPSGVAYGHFRSNALGDFRLYAWRPGPYVLVETRAGRIIVTPDEPDAFVAAVRAEIAP
jgi:hypothetical protein